MRLSARAGQDQARSMAPRAPTSPVARLWRDYSLGIVVAVMFVVSMLLHAVFGWWQYAADQAAHGAPAAVWGPDGFVVYFGEWTFQNWQSEFLEVLVLIVLTSFLVHKGSHESKDSSDRLERKIDRLEEKIDRLADERIRRLEKTG
jgi:succinate dehydrogenase hydrophobic anchor subunit